MLTVVLDDDPTGTQAMANVPIVLDWSGHAVATAVHEGDPSVHLLTNVRAHSAAEAGDLTASAASAARAAFPGRAPAAAWRQHPARLRVGGVPRGARRDQPRCARRAAAAGAGVPGRRPRHHRRRPSAGARRRAGAARPDGDATDAHLSYADARLAQWAHDRSGGELAAADAVEIPLAQVRAAAGAEAVAAGIRSAAAGGRPAVVVPDAETIADLEVIASGLRLAEADTKVIARCAPAFAAIVTGTAATGLVAPPPAGRGVLVLCGSFVPATTAQLAELDRARPGVTTFADVRALAGPEADREVERQAVAARELIDAHGLAVVATARDRDAGLVDAASQQRIATELARVPRLVDPGVVIAKGGITSAVTARDGLGARSARVVGPVMTGVSLWQLEAGPAYLVVPGNVGGPGLLAELVDLLLPGAGG